VESPGGAESACPLAGEWLVGERVRACERVGEPAAAVLVAQAPGRADAVALAPLTFIPAAVTGAGAAAATIVRLPGGVALEVTDVTAVPTSWIAALAAELKRQS
jgi:hypothetical protein